MMKHAYDLDRDRHATAKLIAGAMMFACVLGFVLDRVLELGA